MTVFDARLKAHAERTDAFLTRLLLGATGVPDRLLAAMRLAVLGGGKRFRPFLVLESARMFDVADNQAIATAGALECVHCYSLAHDDLPAMDNDTVRRGQPTVWAAFDDWTAILAGDALLTLSFEVLSRPETHGDAGVRNELIAALAVAAGGAGMVGGQALDLARDKRSEPAALTLDHVRRLQAMKTGALIRFAVEAGAILGKTRDAERRALRAYGEYLGVVFQIADDLLDATGHSAVVGKATGKDDIAGKATQVGLLGVESARAYLDAMTAAAQCELEPFGDRGHVLHAAVAFAGERSS